MKPFIQSFIRIDFLILSLMLSTIFWMNTTTHLPGWSLVEGLSILLVIKLIWTKSNLQVLPSKIILPYLCLMGWASLSGYWGMNLHSTTTAIYKMIFILLLLQVFINDSLDWEKWIRVASITLGSILSFIWLIFPPLRQIWTLNPNLLSAFLVLTFLLSLTQYMKSEEKSSLPYFLGLSLMSITIFLIGSLGPILCWFLGCLLLGMGEKFKNGGNFSRNKSITLIFFIFILLGLSLIPDLRNRFHHVWYRKSTDHFSSERIQIWKDSFKMIGNHLWKGVGLGSYREVYPKVKSIPELRIAPYAHNEFLNILSELGLIGTGFVLWVLFTWLNPTLKTMDKSKFFNVWNVILLLSFIQSMVDFNLHYPPILILVIYSVSRLLPRQSIPIQKRGLQFASIGLLLIIGILFTLPGIAYAIFWKNHKKVTLRSKGANSASRLDPLNGYYYSQMGRMRDLMKAIDLEPMNVWYRKKAINFYLKDWFNNKNLSSLKAAKFEYEMIINIAPNVNQFQVEYESFLKLWNSNFPSALTAG